MTLEAVQADFRARMLSQDEPHPGLAVYRNNYLSRLSTCLSDAFPVTRSWLGDDTFAARAADFIQERAPASWSLDHYPSGFADWLAARTDEDRLAAQLASIELAMAEVFVERDQRVLTLGDLETIDWDRAQLAPSIATRVVPMASNAPEVWAAIQSATDSPALRADQDARPVLVWRQAQVCRLRYLESFEEQLLTAGPFSFADVCATTVATHGESAGIEQAGRLLAQWAREENMVVCGEPLDGADASSLALDAAVPTGGV